MAERLPPDAMRQIYSMADPRTQIRMKSAAKWMRADRGMRPIQKAFTGKQQGLWTVDRRVMREWYRSPDSDADALREAALQVRAIKRHYSQTAGARPVDVRSFFDGAFAHTVPEYRASATESWLRQTALPRTATRNAIMDAVLEAASRRHRAYTAATRPPRRTPAEAWRIGRGVRAMFADWAADDAPTPEERRQRRIARRAARRLAAQKKTAA